MITITHQRERDGWQYATVQHSDFRLYGVAASAYAVGDYPPNYPMPAIIYVAQLESATLWEYTGFNDIRSLYQTRYRFVKSLY